MGLLNSLEAEMQRLNPANIIAEVESLQADGQVVLSRLATLETYFNQMVGVIQSAAPEVEAAFPNATPAIAAFIAFAKGLSGIAIPAAPAIPTPATK